MRLDRQLGPPPERTFAQLFPWRNVRRALLLTVTIVAIVMVKRSAGPLLQRVTELLDPAPPAAAPAASPAPPREEGRRVRLGPGLAPAAKDR
jgi:hypothetical protein